MSIGKGIAIAAIWISFAAIMVAVAIAAKENVAAASTIAIAIAALIATFAVTHAKEK